MTTKTNKIVMMVMCDEIRRFDRQDQTQPISNDELVLAVNGEIYNDLEIRKKNKDFNFKTNSDSESILLAETVRRPYHYQL